MLETLFGTAMEAPQAWHQGPARLVLAVLLGATAGFERESTGHFAGLRTHALVALGAAGFALISCELFEHLLKTAPATAGQATRIVSAIVGGVGFLGAGAIIHAGTKVKGLTTAAGMWAIAASGTAAGLGLFAVAVTIALVCVGVLLASMLDREAQEVDRAEDNSPPDEK
ncbi:MAG: MgtC/SapB family protein [Phycisphaerales bacterium]